MAEISTAITYTVRFTDKEYKLVAKSLALLAGVDGPRATPEDREAAAHLNDQLIDLQAADLRDKLTKTEHKRQSRKPG